MIRYFITGDFHRTDVSRIDQYFKPIKTELQESTNYLIALGDVGINYYLDSSDYHCKEWFEKKMKEYNMTLICVRGNHEFRPEDIPTYKCSHYIWENESQIDGWFWVEENFPRLLFCDNFGAYTIGDKSFYVVGGAYSVDKDYRIEHNMGWFDNEQLNIEEQNKCLLELQAFNGAHFDWVFTHTCPLKWIPQHRFLSFIDQSKVDKSMEEFLDKVEECISYDKWYFGHYHWDEIINNKAEMLYRSVKEFY